MSISFSDLINKSITEPWAARKREPHVFWPSEASIKVGSDVVGKCHRASFYTYMGVPATNPIRPESIRKMESGKSIEKNEHEFAKKAGILIANNVKARKTFQNGIIISAEIDAVYGYNEKEYIIEIKSFGGYYAKKSIFGNTKIKGMPKDDHILQTMLYLDIFPKYSECIIRYIDRTDCVTKEHSISLFSTNGVSLVKINGELHPDYSLERIMKRFEILDQCISTNILPSRDYSLKYSAAELRKINSKLKGTTKQTGHWRCSYCRYRTRCENDGM